MTEKPCCNWCKGNALMQEYHDTEWGIPEHRDQKLFEHLMMEVMQCGLSWLLVLKKREILRQCFAGFDYNQVALFGEAEIERILETPGMIRSRRKIEAVIADARAYQKIREEFGSFAQYMWGFTDGKILVYRSHQSIEVAENELSRRLSGDLKKRGFRFVGPVTIYSHLQACGVICDHEKDCWRYEALIAEYPIQYED